MLVRSKDRVETNGCTDGRTGKQTDGRITASLLDLPCFFMSYYNIHIRIFAR